MLCDARISWLKALSLLLGIKLRPASHQGQPLLGARGRPGRGSEGPEAGLVWPGPEALHDGH
eukprot:4158612-Lingulodinium_polyedra.AAC.1